MIRATRRAHVYFLACLVVAAAAAAQEAAQAPASPTMVAELETIPYPDMSGLEDAVKEQLNEAHGDLQAWLRQKEPPAAALVASFGRLGQILHAYELHEAALACYRNASRLDPESFLWHYYTGHVEQKSGRFEKAGEAYRKSLELEPRNLAARVHLGEVYQTQNRAQEAAAEYLRALELDADNPAAKANLGELALAQGDHEAAAALLSSVLAQVPSADRLHYPLAMAYRGTGERDKALEHLEKVGAVGVRVDDPLIDALQNLATGERVYLLRGRQAFGAGRYGEAASEFRKAMEADPRSARVRVNLGSALGQMGDTVGALEQFQVALALDPANVTAQFNAAVILERQGELEQAARHFQAAIDLKYDDPEPHHRLGLVKRRLGRDEEALEHLHTAAGLVGRDENILLDEAVLLVGLKRYEEALEALESAHAMMPESGMITHALARMLAGCPDAGLRDGERALGLARRVWEAVPSASHAITVAQALAELDRCSEAAEWQAKVLGSAGTEVSAEWVARQQALLARYEAGSPCR